VQNVVTYNVVLDVDNKDELLKPGMTAQVRLVVDNRPKALRIPTAALRFRPSEDEQEKERKALADKKAKEPANSAALPQLEDDLAFRSASETARVFKVYKLDAKNEAKPVDIRIGLSNFRYTEVVSGDLKAGERVVTRSLAPSQDM